MREIISEQKTINMFYLKLFYLQAVYKIVMTRMLLN